MRYTQFFAYKVEATLTKCDLNISVFIPAYLMTWQIHLDNVRVFTWEWAQYGLFTVFFYRKSLYWSTKNTYGRSVGIYSTIIKSLFKHFCKEIQCFS